MKKILQTVIICIGLFSVSYAQNIDDFTFTDTKGVQHNLYTYLEANKTVVIKFWFRSCGNCQAYSTEYNNLYLDNGSNTGNVIVLSMEIDQATNSEIDAWLNEHGVTYPACGGASVESYWGSSWYSVLGGGFTQVVVIDANASDPVNSSIAYTATGYIDATKEAGIVNAVRVADVKEVQGDFISSIYPNPVQDNFTVTLSDDFKNSNGSVIELYDITGMLVNEKQVSALNSKIEFDMKDYQSGSYLLKFKNNSFAETHKIQLIK